MTALEGHYQVMRDGEIVPRDFKRASPPGPPEPRAVRVTVSRSTVITVPTESLDASSWARCQHRGWLSPAVLGRFGFEEAAADHHRLVDAVDRARSQLRDLPGELAEIDRTRAQALAMGQQPMPLPDRQKLTREREEQAAIALGELVRFCDRLLGELRAHGNEWIVDLDGDVAAAEREAEEALAVAAAAELKAELARRESRWLASQALKPVKAWSDVRDATSEAPVPRSGGGASATGARLPDSQDLLRQKLAHAQRRVEGLRAMEEAAR